MKSLVLSGGEAVEIAKSRIRGNLPTFPAAVFAEGHSPGKEPVRATDMNTLAATVETAIIVSITELGGNKAEVHWPV